MRKWYLDCAADDGTVWIGYWGSVRWSAVRIPFVSSLLFADGRLSATTALSADPEPLLDGGVLTWSSPSLGVDARLTSRGSGAESQLHESVRWRCVMPSADVVVQLRDREIRGLGYGELLEITVAPWRLPIRELLWGRATCGATSLVWIRWYGAHPLQLAYRNGIAQAATQVEDDRVLLADGMRLEMSDCVVLRDDSLGNTLKPLGAIAAIAARALNGAIERKWRSRGTLFEGDRPISEGWVIHERVEFAAH
jgi:hypothetical protein